VWHGQGTLERLSLDALHDEVIRADVVEGQMWG
jgi:hypothetical protein